MPNLYIQDTNDHQYVLLPCSVISTLRYVFACLVGLHTSYLMGAKIVEAYICAVPPHFIVNNRLDCSGFVRYALHVMTAALAGGPLPLPDGSVQEHDWIEAFHDTIKGGSLTFKSTDVANRFANDGVLRICFIAPANGHAGHVYFTLDGVTYECCGSGGVCSRAADAAVLENTCAVYVLAIPGIG